jgi:hypothetical protein
MTDRRGPVRTAINPCIVINDPSIYHTSRAVVQFWGLNTSPHGPALHGRCDRPGEAPARFCKSMTSQSLLLRSFIRISRPEGRSMVRPHGRGGAGAHAPPRGSRHPYVRRLCCQSLQSCQFWRSSQRRLPQYGPLGPQGSPWAEAAATAQAPFGRPRRQKWLQLSTIAHICPHAAVAIWLPLGGDEPPSLLLHRPIGGGGGMIMSR